MGRMTGVGGILKNMKNVQDGRHHFTPVESFFWNLLKPYFRKKVQTFKKV